jgi:hypothetical protein
MNIRRLALALCATFSAVVVVTFILSLSNSHSIVVKQSKPNDLPKNRFRHSKDSLYADATPIHYVAITGTDNGDCSTSGGACRTIQYAVDQAGDGDEVRIATGVFTGVQGRPAPLGYDGSSVVTQAAYISRTLTVRGGYTTTDWSTSQPISYPTTLTSLERGRVLFITGGITVTLSGLRTISGSAYGLGGGTTGDDAGSGIYSNGASITIDGSEILSNHDSEFGGGLYLKNGSAKLHGAVFRDNIAWADGGALYASNSDVIVIDSIITDNSSEESCGGAIYAGGSDVNINGSTITRNFAFGCGGGLALSGSSVHLGDNTISDNNAGLTKFAVGGGVFLGGSTAALDGNTIAGNRSGASGGGIALRDTDVILENNTIAENEAQIRGAGVDMIGRAASFLSNTIEANSVTYYVVVGGAGLYIGSTSGTTLRNNTVISNTIWHPSSGDGGGLLVEGSDVTLVNNVLAGNRVSGQGGGLFISGSSATLLHSTVARNSVGRGTGIFIEGSTGANSHITLTNTVLVSHRVGISVTTGNTATVNGILWFGTPITKSQGVTTVVSVSNEHVGDPGFAPDGYHLTAGSAAIDRGVFADVNLDIDGDPRPDWCFPDLGADELITDLECKHFYLPLVVRYYLGTTGPHNLRPNLPASPAPADNSIYQSVDVNLSWSGGDPDGDSVTYDVFLEANDITPNNLVCSGVTKALCDPGMLNEGTHYYWKVIARDEHGATRAGPVWDFDTHWALSNDPPWYGGVVNIVPENDMDQSFGVAGSVLSSVAFSILTMNPGRGGDTLTMRVRREDGGVIATDSRYVEEGFNDWLGFELGEGGIRVTPDQSLVLELEDIGKVAFGWKYDRDTYSGGSAMFFGSLRIDRDFLFRVNY